jgi:lipopolysaccharide biosynthesis glycosyltransferase
MKLRIYTGFDSSNDGQMLASNVCNRSLLKNTTYDIEIITLVKSDLEKQGLFYRNYDASASTEFTYTRFLVPYLNNYEGYAIFCDSDFLWCCDVSELLQYIDQTKAVSCVKHNHVPTDRIKMNNQLQTTYPRKNWSSLMIFNCNHPSTKQLTIKTVNEQSPAWLHRMSWANDHEIGDIPKTYNYLVGYYHDTTKPKVLHYTDGGPWFYVCKELMLSEPYFAKLWTNELIDDEPERLQNELNRQENELKLHVNAKLD